MTNIPACYTTNKSVTIKASFTILPADISSANIWAENQSASGSLGNVNTTMVNFVNGIASDVSFQLSDTTPNCIKKTDTDSWLWKFSYINGSPFPECEITNSGPHTIYTILNEPVAPWENSAGNQKNAWAKAFDFTIETAGCNGDSASSNALAHVTQFLHSGHGLTYDSTGGGGSGYGIIDMTGTGNFDLSGFLSGGGTVNCYDQAAGLVLLSRLLGIHSDYLYMQPFGYVLQTDLVGIGQCNNPFFPFLSTPYDIPLLDGGTTDKIDPYRTGFGNHAFVLHQSVVYDACAGPHLGTELLTQYAISAIDVSSIAERLGSVDLDTNGVIVYSEVNSSVAVGNVSSMH